MDSKINIRRISNLLRYEIVLLKQPIMIGTLGIVAFILAISAMASSFGDKGVVNASTMGTIFSLLFFLGGVIVSSLSFHRVNTKGGALNYLSLPASREEKFLVIFLMSIILYPVGVTAIFLLGEGIAKLGWSLSGGTFNMYLPFADEPINAVMYSLLGFVFYQAFYFLGSILFKKYAFLKTTVAFLVISFVFWLIVIIGGTIFASTFAEGMDNQSFNFSIDNETIMQNFGYAIQGIAAILIIGLWLFSFMKFKKKEV